LGSWHYLTISRCVGINVNQTSIYVSTSIMLGMIMMLGMIIFVSTRIVVMEVDAIIDMLDVSSLRGVLWLLQY